ncbi:DUF1289 domain-containing protein [Sphingobium ummariense]
MESPCRNLCSLNAERVCTGCGRTIDEIVYWRSMTDEERRAVMVRLASFSPPVRRTPPSA